MLKVDFSKLFQINLRSLSFRKSFSLVITLILLVGIFTTAYLTKGSQDIRKRAAEAVSTTLTPVEITSNLKTFFETNAKYTTNNNFGVYAMEPIGNSIYLGFSAGWPAEINGALLAKYEAGTISAVLNDGVNPVTEQGFHDMTYSNGILYIAGTDPCCLADGSDEWSLGGIYAYKPGQQIIKHRNMTNVIHTLGLWEENGSLYAATGAHIGNKLNYVGQIFKSTDSGNSWEIPVTLSNYRVHDVIGFNNKLYAVKSDPYLLDISQVVESVDNGKTWEPKNINWVSRNVRLTKFNNRLVTTSDEAINSNFPDTERGELFSIDANVKLEKFSFPGFKAANSFNIFDVDNKGNLYLITEDKRVVRTSDMISYYEVARFDYDLIAIRYWPEKNYLMVASKGPEAKIWMLDLSLPYEPVFIIKPTATPTIAPIPAYYISFSPKGVPATSWNSAEKLLQTLTANGFTPRRIMRMINGTWQTYRLGISINNFPIEAGKGYFIDLFGSEVRFDETLFNNYTDASKIDINNGNDVFIGLPENLLKVQGSLTAEELCSLVERQGGGVADIQRFVRYSTSLDREIVWEKHNCKTTENNFAIVSGQGYMMNFNKPSVWSFPNILLEKKFRNGSDGYSGLTDTFISSYNTAGFPTYHLLEVGLSSDGNKKASLLKFDLSFLPVDSVVTNAKLKLRLTGFNSADPTTVSVYKMLKNWNNLASWVTAIGTTKWETLGALGVTDKEQTPLTTSLFTPANYTDVNLDVTNAVAQWVRNPGNNSGLYINTNGKRLEFASSENYTQTIRPELTVTYFLTDTVVLPITLTPTPSLTPTPTSFFSTVLSCPSGVKLTASKRTDNNYDVKINWVDNNTGEDGYKVLKCIGASCFPSTGATITAANITSYTDSNYQRTFLGWKGTGFISGTTLTYQVRAVKAGMAETNCLPYSKITLP